ncbi:MAG: PAS domain-containing protein, partial [Actinomycetota bacterium]
MPDPPTPPTEVATHEFLQAILESTADGILVVDGEGRTVYANARFAEMWRIPRDQLAAGSDDKLLAFVLDQLIDPEAFVAKVRELYQTSREDLDTLDFKDGRVFERYSRPLLSGGDLAGRVWSFRDVTQQRRSEESVREAESRYRTLVEHIPAVTYIEDLEGPATTLYMSPQAESLLGYTPAEFMA